MVKPIFYMQFALQMGNSLCDDKAAINVSVVSDEFTFKRSSWKYLSKRRGKLWQIFSTRSPEGKFIRYLDPEIENLHSSIRCCLQNFAFFAGTDEESWKTTFKYNLEWQHMVTNGQQKY